MSLNIHQLASVSILLAIQIFFIDRLTAVSAGHFHANTAVLHMRQIVQNKLRGKLSAFFLEHALHTVSQKTPTKIFVHVFTKY